jgi:erythromycin esterase
VGRATLHSVVGDGMTWGFGSMLENEELMRWVRDYNARTTTQRKVRVYGIDLTGGIDGAFVSSRRAVDFALHFLARADSVTWRKLNESLDPLLARFSTAKYAELSATERERLASGLVELTAALKRNRSSIARIASDEDYEWALHSVVVAGQLNAHFEVAPPHNPSDSIIPPDAYRQMTARDSGMAAHNVHVMNSAVEGGVWSTLRQAPSTMGKFLRAMLDRDLVIIGTTAGKTAGDLPRMNGDNTSIEAALSSVPLSRFVLDLRPARSEHAVLSWLSRSQTLHANLNTLLVVQPAVAFDALVFLDTLTPAHWREAPAPDHAVVPDRKAVRAPPTGH